MGFLRNIEWADNTANSNLIVHRFPLGAKNQVNRGSNLTVRESQAAIFSHQGKMADVFLPGRYKLDTDNIPVLTRLMSWKYGFENPFQSDIFFVATRLFPNQKWGTPSPISLRCQELGRIEVRCFGSYAFRVTDPFVFMTELSGQGSTYTTNEIVEYLRSMLISCITSAVAQSKVPFLDLAANTLELAKVVKKSIDEKVKTMGIAIPQFNIENFSLPEDLRNAMKADTARGMQRGNWDIAREEKMFGVMGSAAQNPGAGGMMGPMMGMGMGMGMGGMMGNMMGQQMAPMAQQMAQPVAGAGGAAMVACAHCGVQKPAASNFCPKCGKASGVQCIKCKANIKNPNAKFCPECGAAQQSTCPSCNAALKPGAKFCAECGNKV